MTTQEIAEKILELETNALGASYYQNMQPRSWADLNVTSQKAFWAMAKRLPEILVCKTVEDYVPIFTEIIGVTPQSPISPRQQKYFEEFLKQIKNYSWDGKVAASGPTGELPVIYQLKKSGRKFTKNPKIETVRAGFIDIKFLDNGMEIEITEEDLKNEASQIPPI